MQLSDIGPDFVAFTLFAVVCGLIAYSMRRRMRRGLPIEAVCCDSKSASSQFGIDPNRYNPGAAILLLLTKPTWWRYSVDGVDCYYVKNPLDKKSRKIGDAGIAYVDPGNPRKAMAPGTERTVRFFIGATVYCVLLAVGEIAEAYARCAS